MRTTATDSGPADGWRGARLGAERRDRTRREAMRIATEVDIGEPEVPRVTVAFLVLTGFVTIVEFATYGASPSVSELAQAGGSSVGAIATGSWWKLLVANLLHANILHLAMNVFVIYLTGRWLEHLAGRTVVLATIMWSALVASLGSIVVDSAAVTIGASGVAFGLVGCAVAIDPRARTAAGLIARQLAVVNVVITFLVPGISIGGHLGGLLAGLLVGWVVWDRTATPERPIGMPRSTMPRTAIAVAIPIAAVLAIGPGILPDQAAGLRGAITAPQLARQLSGAQLTGGLTIDDASCEATDDPLEYRCRIDGASAVVRFSARDDQWSLSTTASD